MNKTTCSSDPFPTRLLMSHLHTIIPILQHIVNLCFSCKSYIVIHLIKKPSLDIEMFLKTIDLYQTFLFYPKLLRKLFLFVIEDIL